MCVWVWVCAWCMGVGMGMCMVYGYGCRRMGMVIWCMCMDVCVWMCTNMFMRAVSFYVFDVYVCTHMCYVL